jgi:hypothetical protein
MALTTYFENRKKIKRIKKSRKKSEAATRRLIFEKAMTKEIKSNPNINIFNYPYHRFKLKRKMKF